MENSLNAQAFAIYEAPFHIRDGSIFDFNNNLVAPVAFRYGTFDNTDPNFDHKAYELYTELCNILVQALDQFWEYDDPNRDARR